MTRKQQIKSHFIVHTNGQDEWIKVDKRIYDKAIDMFYAAHEAELKAKDERIAELDAKLKNMCAECGCAKFADNAIKPSEMWKLHLALKDNE